MGGPKCASLQRGCIRMPDKVLCDGIVLTAALREIVSAPGDAEGLLFGQVHRRTINVISDMQGEHSKEETTVVLDYIAVGCGGWHDGRGNIDVEQLQAIVASHAPMRMVGWFSSRMNSQFRASLRECAMHRQLNQWLLTGHQDAAALLFALMGGNQSEAGHVITQDFRTFAAAPELLAEPTTDVGRALTAVPIEFRNLGASTQMEFASFVSRSNSDQLKDVPKLPPATEHPLEAYVAAAVDQLEGDAASACELQQQVSVQRAEVASLMNQIAEQQLLLHALPNSVQPAQSIGQSSGPGVPL